MRLEQSNDQCPTEKRRGSGEEQSNDQRPMSNGEKVGEAWGVGEWGRGRKSCNEVSRCLSIEVTPEKIPAESRCHSENGNTERTVWEYGSEGVRG